MLRKTLPFLMMLVALAATAQTRFKYKGEQLQSGPGVLYVNDRMKTDKRRFTFRHVNEALRFAEHQERNGQTVCIYIEPSVYWLDNPDDPSVRRPVSGTVPFAMEVRLSDVELIGLSDNPEDVVLAVNRGQTQGADGNYTMFHWVGSRVKAENVTFGNYCNVDLVYPRDSRRNRARRKDAIAP